MALIACGSVHRTGGVIQHLIYFSAIQDVQKHSVHTLVFRSLKRTHDMFLSEHGHLPAQDEIRYVQNRSVWSLSVQVRSMARSPRVIKGQILFFQHFVFTYRHITREPEGLHRRRKAHSIAPLTL